jgi:hypothetical protein
MQQWFLPVGLVLAILFALAAPDPGRALNATGLVTALVPLIFLINGYQTRLDMLSLGGRFLAVLASGAVLGLLLSPFLGLAAATLLGLPAAAALGLVVMASMPPTLSSGVILVENAGGHTLWAMLLTILLNLAGIFTIPFMLDLTLEAGAEVAVAPWPLLWRLLGASARPRAAAVRARWVAAPAARAQGAGLGPLRAIVMHHPGGMDVDVGLTRNAARTDRGRAGADRGRVAAGARRPARPVRRCRSRPAPGSR